MGAEPGPETSPAAGRARLATLGAWLVVLAVVLAVWRTRVELTHALPNWNPRNPEGLLKSDPAIVYWLTQEIATNGGRVPEELARTARIQWPDEVDARVEFPLAQPWLAAVSWRALGGERALHEWCLLLFGLTAALTAVGVFGLARELTESRALGLAALAGWALALASWRSTSYVLLGEDLAFPFFAAHLWLLARAARVRTPLAYLLAGLALVLAMMSWHATSFFVAMEAAVLLAWTLRGGANPLAARRAWLVLVPLALGCLLEPMLRGKLQLLSLPGQVAGALLALAWLERRRARGGRPALAPLARAGVALGLLAAAAGGAVLVSRALGGGLGDYSHVFALIAAKLRHLGVRPADPGALAFEVRILWQGPFDTIDGATLVRNLGTTLLGGALLVALGLPAWMRGRGRATDAVLALAVVVTLLATWLIQRTVILAAVVLPVASAVAAARLLARRPGLAALATGALLCLPALVPFRAFLERMPRTNAWYNPDHVRELRQLVGAVRERVPPGQPVAADEVNSTALLAHTGRPILVQPKYEWSASRARLEAYRRVATLGTPEELAAWLRAHRTRFLVYDWRTLWSSRYQVGIADDVHGMQPRTALAQVFDDPRRLAGFTLLWKSAGGRFALYELAE
ncbi:MAG TPA: hypothetical protein VF530_11905 [Planctomycetota bacterium]